MTLSVANTAEAATPTRGLLPLWVGAGDYALFLLAGNRLLIDPDTMWRITVGQWIIDHRAVPETDVYSFTMRGQPWISTQWLAQVLFAKTYAIAGWSGPVVLAATAIAATFALLARFLSRHLSQSTTMLFIAAALALTVPHLLARPHVLAMPIMVMWVGELIAAADRCGAPSFRLLPLMTLWANLHGGFVFGLVLVAPIALDAVLSAEVKSRKSLALRSAAFGMAALKKLNLARVFNDCDFGGYLIANGVAPFIDGRTELYGEKFFVDHNAASGLMELENLFRLLEEYKIEATLMRTPSAATKLLDHLDGWQKVHADDIATIHLRKPGALHTIEPAVDAKAK